MQYQLLVEQEFFDNWTKRFKNWKKSSVNKEYNSDVEVLSALIENFLLSTERSKIITGKYCNIDSEVFDGYVNYLKNQIFKLLPLLEEGGEWKKHLDTIINEITGVDKIFLHSINFISLLGKLESLKACPDFKNGVPKDNKDFVLFRKTIFEAMNLSQELTLVGD